MSTFAFIGCGKKKRLLRHGLRVSPEELYTGQLFRARVQYLEESDHIDSFAVLSAKYGLIQPWDRIATYDLNIDQLEPLSRSAWHVGVVAQFLDELTDDDDPRDVTVELHAGKDYCEPLTQVLELCGFTVELPVEGLGIGEQLAFYKNLTEKESVDAT